MAAVNPQVFDSSGLQSIAAAMPDVVGSTANAYKLKDMSDTSQINTLQLSEMKSQVEQKQAVQDAMKGLPFNATNEQRMQAVEKVAKDPRGGYQGAMALNREFEVQTKAAKDAAEQELRIKEHLGRISDQEYQAHQTKVDTFENLFVPVQRKFEELVSNGMSIAQAKAAVQPMYQSAYFNAVNAKDAGGAPVYGDPQSQSKFKALTPTFDPDKLLPEINNSEKARKFLLDAQKERTSERKEAAFERGIIIREQSATSKTFTEEEGNLMAALAGRGVNLPAGFKSQAQQKALYEGLFRKNPGMTVDEIADGIKSGAIRMVAEKSEARAVGTRQASVDIPLAALTDKGGIFDQLDTAAQKIDLGDARTVSQLRLAWAGRAVANPDILVYKNLIQDARSEMSQALQKGGAPTEGSNARAAEMFPDTMSLGEYQAAKGAAIAVAGAVKRGSRRVLEDISSSKPLGEIISSAKRETGTGGGAASPGGTSATQSNW